MKQLAIAMLICLLFTPGAQGLTLPIISTPTEEQVVVGNNMYLNIYLRDKENGATKLNFCSIPSMILKEVEITFENPPQGDLLCYTGYIKEDDLYIAESNLGGDIIFMKHYDDDVLSKHVPKYNFGSGNVYCCRAFEVLNELNQNVLLNLNVRFGIFLVSKDNIFHGLWFGFNK